jgi:hypothetical protein
VVLRDAPRDDEGGGVQQAMTEIMARTVKGFCEAYGVGRTMAYALMRDGTIAFRQVGDRRLIVEASARAWFEAQPSEPTSVPTYEATIARKRKRTEANGKSGKSVSHQRVA